MAKGRPRTQIGQEIKVSYGRLEKSALPRPLAKADAGQDMSLNRCFRGKPVFFEVPVFYFAKSSPDMRGVKFGN
jgi:hypothetical protein